MKYQQRASGLWVPEDRRICRLDRDRDRDRDGASVRAAAGGGGGGGFGVKWSDDFNRADNAALGGDWTEDGTASYLAISGNRLVRTGTTFQIGSAWVATGAAVAVQKTRLRLDALGFAAQGADIRLLVGWTNEAVEWRTAGVAGYAIMRTTSGNVRVVRTTGGSSSTVLASRDAGLAVDGSTGADLSLEASYDVGAGEVTLKLFVGGVQAGADIVDSSPGDAAEIFTVAAYPYVHSQGNYYAAPNNPRVDELRVWY